MNIKEKSFSFEDIASTLDDEDTFNALKNPKTGYLFKNIIAIPHLLTNTFIHLESTDSFSVAKAFTSAIMDFDDSSSIQAQENKQTKTDLENEESEEHTNVDEDSDSYVNSPNSPEKRQLCTKKNTNTLPTYDILLHVIQFCHLCAKGKITPVLYTEMENWYKLLPVFLNINKNRTHLRKENPTTNDSKNDASIPSPDRKISRKYDYLINTMIKLQDTIDKNKKNKEEKDPEFNRLEEHRKKLILNALSVPPFDIKASTPTEIYLSFLT
jgi:hypothetical protein